MLLKLDIWKKKRPTENRLLNDKRYIKGNKYDTKYFDELLERIKNIRVMEEYEKLPVNAYK